MAEPNRKKVLFIVPSLAGGGAERVLLNIMKRLDYTRFDLTLCTVLKDGIYLDEVPKEIKMISLMRSKRLFRLLTYLQIRFGVRLFFKWLIRKKVKEQYDVGISVIDSTYTDLLFSLHDRVPLKYSWVHASIQSYSNYSKYLDKGRVKTLKKNRYQKLDKIIFVSNDSKNEFVQVFGHYAQMPVLYNFLDKEAIRSSSCAYYPSDFSVHEINVVAVGSLLPVKGYEKLIYAARLLNQDGLRFKIRILGTGPLYKKLNYLIDSLSLSNKVELTGFRRNPYAIMKHSDIFVMTSQSEALPTSLIEAMILELPVLVTDAPGCREVTENGKYGVVMENSIEGIYKGLKQLIGKDYLRKKYSLLSRQRALFFDDDRILSSFYQIIDQS